jgi:hypothetical protein
MIYTAILYYHDSEIMEVTVEWTCSASHEILLRRSSKLRPYVLF